jgi:hypothetical protein
MSLRSIGRPLIRLIASRSSRPATNIGVLEFEPERSRSQVFIGGRPRRIEVDIEAANLRIEFENARCRDLPSFGAAFAHRPGV